MSDVHVESYELRILAHYLFELGPLIPYVGIGLETSINAIDDGEIEAVLGRDVDGTGIGGTGIAGLELPLGAHFSLFGEARISVDTQLTSEEHHHHDEDVDVENLGGFSGRGGLRIRF